MSEFFFTERDEAQAREDAALSGMRPDTPGFFDDPLEDLPTAAGRALTLGLEGLTRTARDVPRFGEFLFNFDEFSRQAQAGELEEDRNWYEEMTTSAAEHFQQARREVFPAPAALSESARILGSVVEVVGAGTVGAVVGGPAGSAAALGEGYYAESYQRSIEEGLDEETAQGLAFREGGTMAILGSLPVAAPGRILTRATTGAGINVAAGGASRFEINRYLTERGELEAAKRYQWLDPMSVGIDLVLGATFGAAFGPRGTPRPSQRAIDAALTQADAIHREVGVAPGIPADGFAARASSDALSMAESQAFADQPIDVTASGVDQARFIPHPDEGRDVFEAYREAVRSGEIPRDPVIEEMLGIVDEDGGLMFSQSERLPLRTVEEQRRFVSQAASLDQFEGYSFKVEDDVVNVSVPIPESRTIAVYPNWTFKSAAEEHIKDPMQSFWYRPAGPPSAAETGRIIRRVVAAIRDHAEAFGPRSYHFQTLQGSMGKLYKALFDREPIPGYQLRDKGGDEYVLARQPGAPKPTGFSRAQINADIEDLPLMARGDLRGGASPEVIARALVESLGADAQRLLDTAKTEVVATTGELSARTGRPIPADAKGAYDPRTGKSYIVAENTSPEEAARILLHEVGVHTGMRDMLGAKLYGRLGRDIESLIEAGNPVAKAARERVEALVKSGDMKAADAPEETIAYLVETAPDLPFVRRLLAQIRQWLWRTFKGAEWIGRLTVDDIRELAVTSLRRAARQADRKARGADGELMFDVADDPLRAAVNRAIKIAEDKDDSNASIQSLVDAAREIKAEYDAYMAQPPERDSYIRRAALASQDERIAALAEDADSVAARLERTDEKAMAQRALVKDLLAQHLRMLARSRLFEAPARSFDEFADLLGDKRTSGRGLGQTGRREPPPGIPDPDTPEYAQRLAEAKAKPSNERTREDRALIEWDQEQRPKLSVGEERAWTDADLPTTKDPQQWADTFKRFAGRVQQFNDLVDAFDARRPTKAEAVEAYRLLDGSKVSTRDEALRRIKTWNAARADEEAQARVAARTVSGDDDGFKFSIGERDADPVKQAIADEPDLTVPTVAGEVRAETALEAANENVKQAREMGKGFAAAASCAAQHGIDPIMRASTTIAAGHGLGGALAIPAGWAVANAAFRENESRNTPEYRRDLGRAAVRGRSNDERFPVTESAGPTPLHEIAGGGEPYMEPDLFEGAAVNQAPGGPKNAPAGIGGPEEDL